MHLSELAQSLELWESVSLLNNYAVFFCTSLLVFEETQSYVFWLFLLSVLFIVILEFWHFTSTFIVVFIFYFLVFEHIISKVLKLPEKKRQLLYVFKNLYETLKF